MRIGHSGVAKRLVLAAMLLGAWCATALAQQPTPDQIAAIRQSCRSDFMSRCAGVQPGGKDALECLKRNAGSVSALCKSALDAVGPKPAAGGAEPAPAAAPPPAPAANKPEPAGTPPASAPEPSPAAAPPSSPTPERPPTEAGNPPPPQVAAVRAACRADFGVHCPGVKPAVPPHCDACKSMPPRFRRDAAAPWKPWRRRRRATASGGTGGAGRIRPRRSRRSGRSHRCAAPGARDFLVLRSRASGLVRRCAAGRRDRIIQCLADQAPRLSPTCYGAIARAIR